ncbi:putative FBD-associated F-box protein At5g53635 [Eutrema salsugineum]|uniref:putative FBD-associated F-box protein At5g53635 n=1 Tax=Eutrema salsugineum TaxID=72664 RepID=UPI000CED7D6B|nr:putative FBD-associated F-box protein At5g53635 [Eutrema salsugineum]XP_024010613.1 putative FBD-associated F-box protein At5g53635 [Eutrema salsugineum]
MVDGEKSKQARFKGLRKDKISQLPDPLICQILSQLPTKDSVRTSVLSTRWRSLWLWVPLLELDSQEFPDFSTFASFGDRFFDSRRASCIDKLKLNIPRYENGVDIGSYLKSWIDAAVKRKIRDLYVSCPYLYEMTPSLYICETLASLTLDLVALPNAEFVSLPCLKTMHLTYIKFPNEATFERLVSSCPVLEELEIDGRVNSDAKVFRVLSTSLKSLTISLKKHVPMHVLGSGVVIDAPRLCFLSIKDNLSESFIIANMDSSASLYLSLSFALGFFNEVSFSSARNRLRSFLLGISKVRDMTTSKDTFELFFEYSKFESLPQFRNMSRLDVTFCVSNLIWLPTFLESCPNLKSLTMVCSGGYNKTNEISFSSVPECLLSSLEFVDFKDPIKGCAAEMELVGYFLKNSAILKKLTLCLATKDDILKKILEMPRGSSKCEVVILLLVKSRGNIVRFSSTSNRLM